MIREFPCLYVELGKIQEKGKNLVKKKVEVLVTQLCRLAAPRIDASLVFQTT